MVNVCYDSIEDYNCCYTVGDYRAMLENGVEPKEALKKVAPRSRDNARTPYQWDATENAGFTTGKPWIKVNPSYTKINLEADRKAPDSIFAYYQKLTAMRKEQPAVLDGKLDFLLEDHPDVVMYLRSCPEQTLLVVINLSDREVAVQWPEQVSGQRWQRILTNREETAPSMDRTGWLPWEAEVYTLN